MHWIYVIVQFRALLLIHFFFKEHQCLKTLWYRLISIWSGASLCLGALGDVHPGGRLAHPIEIQSSPGFPNVICPDSPLSEHFTSLYRTKWTGFLWIRRYFLCTETPYPVTKVTETLNTQKHHRYLVFMWTGNIKSTHYRVSLITC